MAVDRSSSASDPLAGDACARYQAMAEVRGGEGHIATGMGRYFATEAAVRQGLREVERFVGSFVDTSALHPDKVILPALPEPEHSRLRGIVNSVIAARHLDAALPFIRETAAQLVTESVAAAADGGPVDLVATLADPLPTVVIAHVLGVPAADQDRFRLWSDELLAAQGETRDGDMARMHPEFAAYVQREIDARRTAADPPDDVITRLIAAGLSDAAVCTQTMFLIVAGNETTRNLIGNCLRTLAESPDLYAAVRADRDLVTVVVEESLRHDSPVQLLAREVLADGPLGGCPLTRGDRVVFGIASANRDEARFPDADEFRIDRPHPRDHLAFGTGAHVCPGAALARAEAVAVLHELCDQVAVLELDPGFVARPNPVFWALGQRTLPCLVTPDTAVDTTAEATREATRAADGSR
ncbi:cytochrome P450 [Yinghuangia soli]|uniref:Cytochrome P450 n=1 Tax=Yinghuangia soli TaxID=2908204 RepID=A0AA41Q594_9ACTN|nr:cytochrome P450 [Yinghuangia soli]MCF2531813.1 cytochrome P450 [Yinghuangia soli]